MSRAGVFAGELSTLAPADGDETLKPLGYVWLQYGEVAAGTFQADAYKPPTPTRMPIRKWKRNS